MKLRMPQLIISIALLAIGWFSHGAFPGGSAAPGSGQMERPGSSGGRGSGGYQYGGQGSSQRQEVVPVEVTSSMLAVIRERVRGSGILEPERQVSLLSRVEGSVDVVHVVEGQQVGEGFVLCTIDQEELRISEQLARIEMEQASATLERLQGLSEIRGVATQELEDSRFTLQKAEANHARSLIDLGHSQPEALFDGIIIRRRIEPGQYVRVGDELFAFADFEPLRVRMYLPESEVGDVALGQRCVLRTESDGPVLSEGTVERISPVVDRQSLTVEVLTTFPEAAVTLRPGAFAHIDIITRTMKNRIVIPSKAVLKGDGRSRVFRLLEDGETVQEIDVVTGYENETIIVCEEGLGLGDRVVVQGLSELEDRDRVSVYREIPVQVDSLTVERQDDGTATREPLQKEPRRDLQRSAGERGSRGAGKAPGRRPGKGSRPLEAVLPTGATPADPSGSPQVETQTKPTSDASGTNSSGG
jgi:membrane fusion protein (multidrug efflux system)